MVSLNFSVDKTRIRLVMADSVTSGCVNTVVCHFNYDESYKDMDRIAVFENEHTAIHIPLNDLDECLVPASMYYAEGTHEGIVPKALYMEVQEIRASRKQLFCSTAKPQQYPFTGIIRCENCGKNYRRVVWKNKVYWNCPTYINEGKDACPSKKIPQDILEAICAEVLDIDSFDSAIFLDRIDYLSIPYNGCIRFFMKGGAAKDMQWSNKPRSASWTPEMKDAARAKTQSRIQGE